MLPLSLATMGKKYKVIRINGRDEQKRHLNNLGFVEGETVQIANEVEGNLIIAVKDSRIALSKEMSNRIVVEEINE